MPANALIFDFKFPEIIPIRSETGLFNLKVNFVPVAYRSFVSSDGYILCKNAQNYLSSLLTQRHNIGVFYRFNYENGKLITEKRSCFISKNNFSNNTPPISSTTYVDIGPMFKLPLSQWPFSDPPISSEVRNKFPWYYATPWKNPINDDNRTFSVFAPDWENELLMEQPKSEKILRLMERLREKHSDSLPQLTHNMLKTVVLHQLLIVNWQRDWVSLLSEMWTRLVDNLRAGRLDSFLVDGLNLLDCMEPEDLGQCVAAARDLLSQILEARYNGSRRDLEKLFGITLK